MTMLHPSIPTSTTSAVDYTHHHHHQPTPAVPPTATAGDDCWNVARANFNGWPPPASTQNPDPTAAFANEHLPHATGGEAYAAFNGMPHHHYSDIKPSFYYPGQYATGFRGLPIG